MDCRQMYFAEANACRPSYLETTAFTCLGSVGFGLHVSGKPIQRKIAMAGHQLVKAD